MKKLLKIFAGIVLIVLATGCNKKIAPSAGKEVKEQEYDVAKFDYFYVEAVKQKLMGNFGDALKYFEQCIKINPRSDAAYYQMGQVIASGGDIGTAKKYVRKALALDERNLWYLVSLSGMYYNEKNIDSAIIYYEKAVKYFPDNENIQLALGNLYIEKKEYVKANDIFDSFDRKYGINDASTLSSVRSLMAEGKFDAAKAKAEAFIAASPDDILFNGLIAEIYRSNGEPGKAMEVYTKLLEKNPENPQVLFSLADFLISEKNYDDLFGILNNITMNNQARREDKINLFAKLLEIPEITKSSDNRLVLALMVLEANYKDDDIVPLLRADLLVKQGKLPEGATRLEEMIKQRPANYPAWEKLLLIYMELRDYDMLLKRGEEAASRFNMSFLAKVLYANAALEKGKYEIALGELKKAEIIAGDNNDFKVQVLTMRADAYYRMKDYDKAFLTFEEALKFNSNDLTVLNNYAYYLAEQDMKLKEAEDLAKRVIDKEKSNTTFLDTYGWVLYKRGKLNEAAKVMETIINSGDKPDAEWYEHYGFILKKQKKCVKAVENWKRAIELDSSKTNLLNEIEKCQK